MQLGVVQSAGPQFMNRSTMQDFVLRGLVVVAGILSAVLLVLKGQAQAVPALAIGALLGTAAMSRFDESSDS